MAYVYHLKKTLLITSPFVAVGYLMIGLAPNKIVLYLGRIISTCALSLHVAAEGLFLAFFRETKILRKIREIDFTKNLSTNSNLPFVNSITKYCFF